MHRFSSVHTLKLGTDASPTVVAFEMRATCRNEIFLLCPSLYAVELSTLSVFDRECQECHVLQRSVRVACCIHCALKQVHIGCLDAETRTCGANNQHNARNTDRNVSVPREESARSRSTKGRRSNLRGCPGSPNCIVSSGSCESPARTSFSRARRTCVCRLKRIS